MENRRECVTDSCYAYVTQQFLFRMVERQPPLIENKPDGSNPNSNNIHCCVRKNEGKFYCFWQTDIFGKVDAAFRCVICL